MAATNQAIQILTTLEYLGKYGGTPYFGLVLQTGVSQMLGGTLTIDSKIQNILEPWMWWDPGKPQPIAQTDASKSLNVQPPKIDLWWATPVAPVPTLITPVLDSLAFSVDRSITDQLGKDCTSALPTVDRPSHYLDWSDPASKSNSVSRRADGRNVLPWPAHLAQVTRYPYPIPHLLNLSFLLKVKGFDPSMFTDQTIYFFATVSFKTTVGANIVTYTAPDPVKDKDKFTPPDANSRLVIPLVNQDNRTDYSVAVTTQPLPLKGLSPAAFAVTPSPTTYTAETADWQAHLSSSVASTFDLSARLVDTVRQACDQVAGPLPDPKNVTAKKAYDDATSLRKAVAAEFNGFVTAVLTAQREIVAYGCQTGPNGKSLIDRLLDAWVTDSKNPKNRAFATALSKDVNTQRASETINNVASFDTWLALLKGLPVFATNPILPPSPAGSIATVFDGTKKGKADTDPAYKKGDTVIFHGRCYIATSDVPSPTNGGSANVIDATHWRCLTPLLPFYVKDKFYKIGDQVLFGDSVYQAVADPVDINTPQPAPPNAGAWVSPSAFTPKVDPTNLPDRIIAVEHLQLQFTQPDILSQILLAQWKSVFDAHSASWSTAENAQFQSFLNNASANLAVWDVRGLLLQCHLNESWTKITQSPTSRYSVRTQIPIQLDARIDELLNQLPSAPGTMPAFAAALKVKVEAWIADRINLLVPAPTSAPAQPTRSSQGLSVMLGTLDANGDKLDQSDPLRSIAGYCVLMRPLAAPRTAASSWRCLNAGIPIASVNPPANIAPGNPAQAIPAVQGLTDPVVIPVPMHNQDGLRRAILTYDNQPLMCSSPAHAFGDGLVPAPTRDDSRKFDRMISFQHLSVSKELAKGVTALERWKIPGLAFKQSYEFLLGTVSNSGALPPEFADPQNPGIFKFDSLNKPPDAIHKPLPPTITPVSYFRTVPVGDLRFASSFSPTPLLSTPPVPLPEKAGTFDKLRLPPIPDDVQPRASEFFASSLAPVPTAADKSQVMPPVGTTPGKPSKPLIVLSPYPTNASYAEFDLWIHKPTTDFLTWDRTQAAITGTHQARQWAWQLFNTNARKQNSSFDLSLEDPAVDSLSIDVKDETGASVIVTGLSTLPWLHADIQNPTTATALQTTTQPIALKIVTNVDAPTKLTGSLAVDPKSSSTFTLTLPQGFLGSITLQPKLRAGFEKQFATGISSAPGAYTLLVETANRAFPQQDKLQNALSIQPPVAPTDPITFTLVGQSDQAAWKQICRVDLQAQLWRWDGRPARSFPFDQITPIKYYGGIPAIDPKTSVPVPPVQQITASLLQWELETFATRTASDSTTRPMVRRGYNFVANEDRGTELGATYYRAGVTAYNRYGSLVPSEARSTHSLNDYASIPGADGAWVRRFIPGRYTLDGSKPGSYKPPKPAIKYIVPLTGAYGGSQQAAASVLVVVQGPWFAIAGLAEDIRVEIVTSDKQNHPNEFPEAGPDPIYYRNSADHPLPTSYGDYYSPFTPPPDPSKKTLSRNPLFHGPVGHTFDSSDANPLWVTSSFVLDPPQEFADPPVKPGAPVLIPAAQEGTFAQIEFTRIVRAAGMVVADPYKTPPAHGKNIAALKLAGSAVPENRTSTPPQPAQPAIGDIFSDPTDPVWVQFLPSRFLPIDSADFGTLVLNSDKKQGFLICDEKTPTTPVKLTHDLRPDPKDPSFYRFALLLTQEVPDLLGRRGQERFVDMLLQPAPIVDTVKPPKTYAATDAAWKCNSPLATEPKSQNLIARIVVIQRQVNTTALCGKPPGPPPSSVPCPYLDITDAADLWKEMFPQYPGSATPEETAQDATSRIIAVSPPIPAYDPNALPQSCKVDTTFKSQNIAGKGE